MRESVRRAGQRLVAGFTGVTMSGDARRLIREFGVGSLILFARNVESPEQVAELVRELQAEARAAGHDLPLLVAVDQEGGRVQRLRQPWTAWPPLRALGRSDSEELARRMGEALAAELAACGIRLDFAPIMDVDTNPRNPIINDRAFGADPEQVGRLGVALIRALQAGGVAACAKHFPGHGDTEVDSHEELPVVAHPRPRLDDIELPPFRRAVEAEVASIMTAHALFPELDPERPATLSTVVVTDLLRGELAYRGVVVADDIEMRAVSLRWAPGAAAVLAARAGCDLIPVCKDHSAQVEAVEALVRAQETGEIGSLDMDDACLRIRRLKERFLLPYADPDPRRAREAAGAGERVAEEIESAGGAAA